VADSGFWRKRADEFHLLERFEGFSATWSAIHEGLNWTLCGEASAQAEFVATATEAAIALLRENESARPLWWSWLDEVIKTHHESDLVTTNPVSRRIAKIAAASAACCHVHRSRALEARLSSPTSDLLRGERDSVPEAPGGSEDARGPEYRPASKESGLASSIEQQTSADTSRSLSDAESCVHDIITEKIFRTLTNAEIRRDPHLKKRLRIDCQWMSGDAAKACLDRIRKKKAYPLSRQITNKRSSHLEATVRNGQKR
jgi:hypothetical protein